MVEPQRSGQAGPPCWRGAGALEADASGRPGPPGESSVEELARWLAAAGDEAARRSRPLLASWVTPLPPQEPLVLFQRARPLGFRFLWRERWGPEGETRLTLVGGGVVQRVDGEGDGRFRAVAAAWREVAQQAWVAGPQVPATGPLLFGGFAFDSPAVPGPRPGVDEGARAGSAPRPLGPWDPALWEGFPPALMVVPQLLVTGWGERFWLSVNTWVAPQAEIQPLAEGLARQVDGLLGDGAAPAQAAPPAPSHEMQILPQDPGPWMEAVAQAARAVREGQVAKVVLARPQGVRLPDRVTAERVLAALREEHPQATLFALDLGPAVFLGATPEHIAQVSEGWVESMALAGSAPRGGTPEADERLGEELLASPKNREEHQVVVEAVRAALAPLTVHLEVAPEPRLLKLPTIQHLFTPVRGRLAPGATLLDVVARMHPTPAVGGSPKEAALALIRRLEGWDRGWYAGPIGWLDGAGNGAFAVALRSGLLRGGQAALFAGCGIMGASQPEEEYREWQVKLRPMLAALEEASR